MPAPKCNSSPRCHIFLSRQRLGGHRHNAAVHGNAIITGSNDAVVTGFNNAVVTGFNNAVVTGSSNAVVAGFNNGVITG